MCVLSMCINSNCEALSVVTQTTMFAIENRTWRTSKLKCEFSRLERLFNCSLIGSLLHVVLLQFHDDGNVAYSSRTQRSSSSRSAIHTHWWPFQVLKLFIISRKKIEKLASTWRILTGRFRQPTTQT